MTGSTISHYKILEKLGSGGMGDVYKAEDTKLGRQVALKFLASHLVSDPEIHKRFEREARAAASLSHPNICHVYEIDEADGTTFLAMELVKGESLDTRIAAGPLPLKDVLDIGRQIAEGLQEAHANGVVHRDIKPGNVIITPDGRVKILDFGLALLTEGSKLTKLDQTVGTVAYMSPEQAQGIEVDHRTDIWALGCVLYEMVTGQRPFTGHYDQALLYEIVNQEQEPITGLRAGVPMELEFIVAKCLAKDREDRTGATHEVARELRTLSDKLKSGRSTVLKTGLMTGAAPSLVGQATPTGLESNRRASRRELVLGVFAGLLLAGLAGISWVHFRETTPERPLRRFSMTPPVRVGAQDANDASVAVSPDGKHIAFVEDRPEGMLWIQDLDQLAPRAIAGTEGAISPFWSPDSEFVGFASQNYVQKVAVGGGQTSRICELPGAHFHGPSWSPDGEVILFGSGGPPHGLYEVSARGGTPRQLISPDEIDPATGDAVGQVYWARFLPREAGARVAVLAFRRSAGHEMAVQDFTTGRRELLGSGSKPAYSRSGHVIYQATVDGQGLWALPFSLETLRATGEAFPVYGDGQSVTISEDQTLVYLSGDTDPVRRLLWFDRRGEKKGEISEAVGVIYSPSLSPDGRLVALTMVEGGNQDVWVYDIARGSRTRLSTSPAMDRLPIWSPAGDEVAFSSDRNRHDEVYIRRADGAGTDQVVAGSTLSALPSDWSRDGNYIFFNAASPNTGGDLWYFKKGEEGEWTAHPFLEGYLSQSRARLSPDGRYLAYASTESEQWEIYVRPFPEGDENVTVSTAGGREPRWSRDGKELFYVEGDTLVAASVWTAGAFAITSTTKLFEHPGLADGYDVSVDGRRFLIAEALEGETADLPAIHIVENWYEEFRERERE